MLFVAYLIANCFPFFNTLVGLLGDSVTPISCWIMPLAMFIKWHQKHGERLNPLEWVLIACELILGTVLFFYGSYIDINDMMDNWIGLGAPFACHCEQIWDTCGCTPDNHAMQCDANFFFNRTVL